MSVDGGQNGVETVTVVAGADLSGLQYKIINLSGTLAVSNVLSGGVLLNKPESGEHATLAYSGRMKAYAGGTVTKGAPLIMTASGTLQVGSQGVVGKALAAASSGALVSFIGNFASTF